MPICHRPIAPFYFYVMDSERFSGISRLYSRPGLERLQASHVAVIGLGGVGSWSVEALARSGVGTLTLIDLDEVCVSNVNRQLHAIDGQFGRPKVDAMADRIRAINPNVQVHSIPEFFTAGNADKILSVPYDFIIDAIDSVKQKCLLISMCRERQIPIIVTGASGGRRDAIQIQVRDLSLSHHDRLLQEVRSRLRTKHGFPPPNEKFGFDCVFSPQSVVYPGKNGTVCHTRDPSVAVRMDCNSGYGTATHVTGTFGFVAASYVINRLT